MNIQTLKEKAREMKKNLNVLYLVFKHEHTPWYAKILILFTISYALSPIDLIPDFIPLLGYLDDLILVPAGIALAIKLIPDDVILECRENSDKLYSIKTNGMYAAIIIVAIWLVIIYFIMKALHLV